MAAEVSKTGVFFDTKNRKIVEKQPEEGILLVAPGHEITPNAETVIALWRDVDAEPERATDLSVVETATQKAPVTTASAHPKK